MTDYLPKDATIEQACQWLQAKTGQTWLLPRLLECGLTPHFWLDYKPGYPAIYGDRIEGYQTRMMFQGDLCRLESDGGDALVNMFAAHDGSLIKIEPGLRLPLSELKFKRDRVERVAEIINKAKTAPAQSPATPAPVVPALVEPNKAGPVANWKMQIQTEATALCLLLRKSGANPTRNSILDSMAKWCRDNNIRTDTKINPSANYLRTHVLGGKHWDVPN
jgi:hypothetical protein